MIYTYTNKRAFEKLKGGRIRVNVAYMYAHVTKKSC